MSPSALWWTCPVHCLESITNSPLGPTTRWMLLICERGCSSTGLVVLRWWLGVVDQAGVKVERPERREDDDLDAGEGHHRMKERRGSLGHRSGITSSGVAWRDGRERDARASSLISVLGPGPAT